MNEPDLKPFTVALNIDNREKREVLYNLLNSGEIDVILGERTACELYETVWGMRMRDRF